MLNKYIIDAVQAVIKQMGIKPDQTDGVETWEEPIYRTAEYYFDAKELVSIKFYMTARGDKRMSIPKLRKYAEVGDYVWFEDISQEDGGEYFRIHIGKELPFDDEQYEQLQVRYG